MMNPGGTGSPNRVISARLAPLPPSRSFWSLSPSLKSKTNFADGPPSAAGAGPTRGGSAAVWTTVVSATADTSVPKAHDAARYVVRAMWFAAWPDAEHNNPARRSSGEVDSAFGPARRAGMGSGEQVAQVAQSFIITALDEPQLAADDDDVTLLCGQARHGSLDLGLDLHVDLVGQDGRHGHSLGDRVADGDEPAAELTLLHRHRHLGHPDG